MMEAAASGTTNTYYLRLYLYSESSSTDNLYKLYIQGNLEVFLLFKDVERVPQPQSLRVVKYCCFEPELLDGLGSFQRLIRLALTRCCECLIHSKN